MSGVRIENYAGGGKNRKPSGKFFTVSPEDVEFVNQWTWGQHIRTGYIYRYEKGRFVLLHRELLGLPRKFDGRQVDHIDRDPTNNEKPNLRIATPSENSLNRAVRGKSKYRGVSYHKGARRWQVRGTLDHRLVWVGSFGTQVEAAHAYDDFAREYYGEFAQLNFPERSGEVLRQAKNEGHIARERSSGISTREESVGLPA